MIIDAPKIYWNGILDKELSCENIISVINNVIKLPPNIMYIGFRFLKLYYLICHNIYTNIVISYFLVWLFNIDFKEIIFL